MTANWETSLENGNIYDSNWVLKKPLVETFQDNDGKVQPILSIAEAWIKQQERKSKSSFIQETLDVVMLDVCLICAQCSIGTCGQRGVVVGNSKFIHHYKKYTNAWYISSFVYGFIALVEHDAHMSTPSFKMTPHKVKIVITLCPNNVVTDILNYGDSTHFYICGV
jgi:hypothetical protein